MYHYRLILEDGVYHYMDGDSAAAVRRAFALKFPTLPAVSRVKRMSLS